MGRARGWSSRRGRLSFSLLAVALCARAFVACSDGYTLASPWDASTYPAPTDAAPGTDASPAVPTVDAGSDADAGTTGPCPGDAGPAMLRIPSVTGSFCIDSTEVTVAHYSAFLATNPAPTKVFTAPGAPASCTGHGAVTPACGQGAGDLPASCVDWCDAYAYCAWAGKRLCGALGGTAATPSSGDTTHEWLLACQGPDASVYPYGNTYEAFACNGKDFEGGVPVAVPSSPLCEGAYPKLYDMSGNLEEWENACDHDAGTCLVRGGGWSELSGQLVCTTGYARPATDSTSNIGIRCCAN